MTYTIEDLKDIMRKLRDPKTGCPWDVKQDFASIAPHTIEEAYEVADAIDRQDFSNLKEELGDLLLQVVFHAQMANEKEIFSFSDVTHGICDKLVRRHPHVFGNVKISTAEEQTEAWNAMKKAERGGDAEQSILDGISTGMPEWLRALKLQQHAARVGFDWMHAQDVMEKLKEETAEVAIELQRQPQDITKLRDEIGDLFFVCVNLARKTGIDFSDALRHANRKFERRFRAMEQAVRGNQNELKNLTLEEQETYWLQVKEMES